MESFATAATKTYFPDPEDDLMESLFQQYERVIVESIVTTFGLDALIKDQHGGDVDTIHNVREIGADSKMYYKNAKNAQAYSDRGDYSAAEYHGDARFSSAKHEARKTFQDTGEGIRDVYTGDRVGFYGKTGAVSADKKAELDHVVECKAIHDDRGRVLAGCNGTDLANSPDNLAWTNKSLNASMGAWAKSVNENYKKEHGCDAPMSMVDMKAYVEAHPDLDPQTKSKMLDQYEKSKKAYEATVAKAYYTNPKFWQDTAKAAGKQAALMGVRQACGFIFTEVWFAVRTEFEKIVHPFDFSDVFRSIGDGIKKGFESARLKYKELLQKFTDGAFAGVMSSVTTTLCNIFFTTAKNVIRVIRQTYASLVQAAKVLFLNPDNLPFGERMRATAKIVATGASIVVGVMVNEALEDTGVGKLPVVGELISTFCGSLVTGIMTCSLLYFLDRSELANNAVAFLNKIPSMSADINYFVQQAELFEQYAAELMKIDLQKFKREIQAYRELATEIDLVATEDDLNRLLKSALAKIGVRLPWQGDFSEFMGNKDNRLVFE